ncbi:DUF3299 domain-containing protein [Pelagicoccus albus]|uniref:DUF3299 domain-containing protein n=2 Tax=Pelagicoccus albus TaxID=415222 RepID=A0A7X1BBC1_9BACT|nr:DUF3299 domain-containing protein [Pelagicoccus albus]
MSLCQLSNGKAAIQGDYPFIGFDRLSSGLYLPEKPEKEGKVVRKDPEYLAEVVPADVLEKNGKKVEIAGYMMPISVKGEKVDEFLLLPDTGACCYGAMPALNGYVFARAKKGVNLLDNVPIRIRGKFTVEEVWQGQFFSHLYFMEVEEVIVGFGAIPKDPMIGL